LPCAWGGSGEAKSNRLPVDDDDGGDDADADRCRRRSIAAASTMETQSGFACVGRDASIAGNITAAGALDPQLRRTSASLGDGVLSEVSLISKRLAVLLRSSGPMMTLLLLLLRWPRRHFGLCATVASKGTVLGN
jgi:hypothetical protein